MVIYYSCCCCLFCVDIFSRIWRIWVWKRGAPKNVTFEFDNGKGVKTWRYLNVYLISPHILHPLSAYDTKYQEHLSLFDTESSMLLNDPTVSYWLNIWLSNLLPYRDETRWDIYYNHCSTDIRIIRHNDPYTRYIKSTSWIAGNTYSTDHASSTYNLNRWRCHIYCNHLSTSSPKCAKNLSKIIAHSFR